MPKRRIATPNNNNAADVPANDVAFDFIADASYMRQDGRFLMEQYSEEKLVV